MKDLLASLKTRVLKILEEAPRNITLQKITMGALRKWLFPILGGIGFLFALISVLSHKPTPPKEPAFPPPLVPFSKNISGIGVVEPKSELVSIGSDLAGIISKVHVQVGAKVHQKDPLITLDQRDVLAQIALLEATVASSKVMLAEAHAQYALVENIPDSRAIAKDDYNRRSFGLQLAKTRLKEAEAQLYKAKTLKDRLTLTSPLEGEVLLVDVRAGEKVASGQEGLLLLGDTSTLHIRVEIDEEQAGLINPQSQAIGLRRSDTTRKIPLTFVRCEPYVRPKRNLAVSGQRVDTRVLNVIYALSDPNERPFVGEQMDVFIENKEGSAP